MIYGAQMLAAGTRIVFQRMGVWRGTELELDLFEGLLAKWTEDPMLGGMTGKGCGKVAVEGFRPELRPSAGQAFVEHCRARRDEILGLLAEMGAVL